MLIMFTRTRIPFVLNTVLKPYVIMMISRQVDGNIGLIFGIGHCPQRGGPFQFLDTYGAQAFVDKMRGYQDSLGFRFEPAQIVIDYANSGKKFMSS